MASGKAFEVQSKDFFKKIFEEMGYRVLEARNQQSGCQNGFDIYLRFLDKSQTERKMYIECKDYTTHLDFAAIHIKMLQLKASASYKTTAFIAISPKIQISNIDHEVLASFEEYSFPVEIMDTDSEIKEIFQLDRDIYKQIYSENIPSTLNRDRILNKLLLRIENLIKKKDAKRKRIIIPQTDLDKFQDKKSLTKIDEKLSSVITGEEDRIRCHEFFCDYRNFIDSLDGKNEQLRGEILGWEQELRLKASRLSITFKTSSKNPSEFYDEFFAIAEKDLKDFMINKYDFEGLQKLLNGIIFQLAAECPMDWRK